MFSLFLRFLVYRPFQPALAGFFHNASKRFEQHRPDFSLTDVQKRHLEGWGQEMLRKAGQGFRVFFYTMLKVKV